MKNITADIMELKELSGFLNAEGKLTSLPSKKKKKILALVWLAEQIPADKVYSEKEFSDLLRTLHTFGDPATLRRELYDYFLIDRDLNGQRYRLNPERPDKEALIAQHCGSQNQ